MHAVPDQPDRPPLRVVERITVRPARRADERPRPLVIRFNPGPAVAPRPASDQPEQAQRSW
jgi:hypothetical protein